MVAESRSSKSTKVDPWEPAGLWVRGFAMLLDLAILAAIGYGLVHVAAQAGLDISTDRIIAEAKKLRTVEKLIAAVTVPNTLLAFAPVLFYIFWHAFWESTAFSGSPGKAAFGAKVTDYGRESITFSQALARNFYKNISVFVLLVGTVAALSLGVVVPVLVSSMKLILIGLGVVAAVILILGYLAAGLTNDKQALHDSLSDSLVLKNVHVSFIKRFAVTLLTAGLAWAGYEVWQRTESAPQKEEATNEKEEEWNNPFNTIKQWFGSSSSNDSDDTKDEQPKKSQGRVYRDRGTPNPISGSKWRYIRPDDAKNDGVAEDAKWWYSNKENPNKDKASDK
ncbi:MAG: RDD family protein [Bdellovibrionales bacterium]|nr:RDD family protein [Bdellovibrionales bacterium]